MAHQNGLLDPWANLNWCFQHPDDQPLSVVLFKSVSLIRVAVVDSLYRVLRVESGYAHVDDGFIMIFNIAKRKHWSIET